MFNEKKRSFFGRIADAILNKPEIDDETIDGIEEELIIGDVGMDTAMKIVDRLRREVRDNYIIYPQDLRDKLEEIVAAVIDKGEDQALSEETPLVIMTIGVNGAGKTTTIAKLAHRLQNEGKTVLLAAADTFRAAAAEQLSVWGGRLGCDVIKQHEGADPSSVIFDACRAAKARGVDVLICDTAGRLQTKKNLMDELSKMDRVITREFPEAARETLLILDASTGKNAVSQAKEFGETGHITGIVLTKLDGTAKGGIAVAISSGLNIPVKYVGVGEKKEDLLRFSAEDFVKALF
jgi:fused signal recognition particle receptor